MTYYDPELPTRVYIDESPVGIASILVQQDIIMTDGGKEKKVWLPVTYSSKTKTAANKGYRKVEEGSLGILQGILEHRIYLYGARFMLVADHKPLVALYSSHSRSLPMCVARHKSRVACFNFDVIYEPGAKNPAMMRAHCEAECKAESVQAPGFQLSFVGCLKWTLCSEQNPFLMKEPLLYVLCLWKGCCIV